VINLIVGAVVAIQIACVVKFLPEAIKINRQFKECELLLKKNQLERIYKENDRA
jgi:hypothetical protein